MRNTGQNLIRIVIASYFMATSLGLISGTNGSELLDQFMAADLARMTGGAVMFIVAYALLCGLAIRVTALLLGMLVFWSSFIAAYGPAPTASVDAFWRDIALVASLMLTYMTRDRASVRRAGIVRRTPTVRKVEVGERVTPRRIATTTIGPLARRAPRRAKLEADRALDPALEQRLAALKSEAQSQGPLSESQKMKLKLRFMDTPEETEVVNIFADSRKDAVA
ncbi:hypothetical protein [Pelagovum pacificum]|uniref:DoxX family protein n=2 Tax=Pelagovum pacificum TaxID=2588711 RepID=A0A5C5GDY1_9RHOB|nr:hypothetical protein [Pelagovum pacificum]QQA44653.1 hypothetical protein I8N54_08825 [Pelagovum pacificum]TNY32237.1 hypothetical protein FHY64_02770 [Pelagovum pacificum]